jgi:predicted AAA+ superfamily ATPase
VVAADWPAWLVRGGLPPVLALATAAERDLWFRGYVQTFIERDLRHLSAVSNLPDFQRLMTLLAQQSGRLINQANLARDAGLSHPTAHRYLNLVEVACLMTRLPPFAANVTAGVVKSPRWFWSDCGLAAWLAGIRAPGDLRHRSDRGFWLEQTLFQTLQVWRAMAPATRRLYFWRDHSGCEVDFILAEHDRLVALEIKASTQVGVGDARGLLAFREALGRKGREVRGVVLHDGPPRPLADNIYALPFGWLVPAESKRSA